jgi:hypothetical protein
MICLHTGINQRFRIERREIIRFIIVLSGNIKNNDVDVMRLMFDTEFDLLLNVVIGSAAFCTMFNVAL